MGCVHLPSMLLTHHSSLAQRGREDGEERATHVGQRVDELPLQEGHEGAQCVEVGLAEVEQALRKFCMTFSLFCIHLPESGSH